MREDSEMGKTITLDKDRINEVTEAICDEYCKWPFNTETQADLNKICDNCPLNNILNDEWPLGFNPYQK